MAKKIGNIRDPYAFAEDKIEAIGSGKINVAVNVVELAAEFENEIIISMACDHPDVMKAIEELTDSEGLYFRLDKNVISSI